jgi:hypothetical protein
MSDEDRPRIEYETTEIEGEDGIVVQLSKSKTFIPRYAIKIGRRAKDGHVSPHVPFAKLAVLRATLDKLETLYGPTVAAATAQAEERRQQQQDRGGGGNRKPWDAPAPHSKREQRELQRQLQPRREVDLNEADKRSAKAKAAQARTVAQVVAPPKEGDGA